MNKSPKYWVACSGGVDSVALLHLMYESNQNVGILHCNFHLRGEASNGDEKFVRELAENLNVPFRIREFETKQFSLENKMNTQLAARELRYNWFKEVIQNENAIVLLAHHYDDQLETFFLQLRRGGKVKGLCGMPVFKDGLLRPLLKYTKSELVDLALKNDWKWREDISNASNDYTRNWYRNEIISTLRKSNFPLSDVVPLMDSFQKVLKIIKSTPIPNSIYIEEWLSLSIWEKDHILSKKQLGEYNSAEIDRMAKSPKGKFIGNEKMKIWNEGKELVFVKENKNTVHFELKISTSPKESVEINTADLFLDAKKVSGEFKVRKWESGDRFQPLGMKGEKSLGKFLRDRKVPTHLKENIQVLVNEKATILGVFGFGVSEKCKVDAVTTEVMRVSVK